MVIPKFLNPTNTFRTELRKRISDYFEENGKKQTGNFNLYLKAVILVLSFAGLYVHLVFFTSDYIVISLLECLLFGLLTAGIGFNVMHDGAHGSFSTKKWLNELAGLSLNFLGANVFMWKSKHNVIHHTYTNIDGVDDDIDAKPFLRLCENQKHYKIHRFQQYYFIFAYSMLYLYWIFFTDYKKYFLGKVGPIPIAKMKFKDHLSFWGFKVLHFFIFIVIPIYFLGFVPWLVGFLVYMLSTGVVLSLTFSLAHVLEDAHFPLHDMETGMVEDVWVEHQLKTTANFATKNKIVSWFTGGLNYQIEHHLFPQISHVHYPKLSLIVKQVCQEYNIPYIEYPKVSEAIASHYSHLKYLGKNY